MSILLVSAILLLIVLYLIRLAQFKKHANTPMPDHKLPKADWWSK